MNIVNVMWSGGAPYMSVHKVHQQMLNHADTDARVANWILLGDGLCVGMEQARAWHLPHRALKRRSPWRLLMPWLRLRLRKALKQAQADVLLLDGMGVARVVLPLLRHLPGVRATVLFHGSTRLRGNDIHLLRALPAECLSIAAVSRTLAQALEQALGRPVQTLRIALDPQVFAGELVTREQARRSLALPQAGRQLFGAVGRLVEGKGFEMLIEAFVELHARQPDAHLVIIGDGELKASLTSRVEALGLDDCVSLCGYRQDLSQLYRALDWLLVPSRSEGLGLVVQEAVLADVPVLCSDLPVFREQLGEAGLYVPVGDQQAWGRALVRCATRDAGEVARQQRLVLAPEQAWDAFRQGAVSLLRS
ncbi:glycosyltransferase [Pseudomonas entomophila]|uniref:glycosyltransferase n=1 Tax=Pseudomonas entomophila TaxID=312306 RepID=UPI0023D83C24|nr:glycosyltransferase [Pseudomonas entomophila]MDF0733874.1 glycosyltransferase [Pseudomonas entomophila]